MLIVTATSFVCAHHAVAGPLDSVKTFNLPAQTADEALTQFARQAKIACLYAYDQVHGITTNSVVGEYRVGLALELMLKDTGLAGSINNHGVLTVERVQAKSVEENNKEVIVPVNPTIASSTEPDGGYEGRVLIEEVMITARRREESLQNAPAAISAFGSDTLKAMGVDNSRDMARFVPNMQSASQGSFGGDFQDNITIRGIGNDREFPDTEQAVGVYIDDVFYPRSAGNVVEMVELERVEVLRGPQGTLFGRNSMAGTIRYVTRKPVRVFAANAEVKYGSFDRVNALGSLYFPMGDNWSGLASFGKDTRDGFVTHDLDQQTNGSKNSMTSRLTMRYENDDLVMDLGITDIGSRTDGSPKIIWDACPLCPPFAVATFDDPQGPYDTRFNSRTPFSIVGGSPHPDFLTLDQTTLHATIAYSLSERLELKSITAKTWLDYEWSQDVDGSPLPVYLARFSENNVFFQEELQLAGYWDGFHYVSGLFFYRERPQYNQFSFNAAQGKRIRDQYYQTDAWAIYAQGNLDITNKVTLTAGARFTSESKKVTSVFTFSEQPGLSGLNASKSRSWDAFTYHLDLTYKPGSNSLWYASVSTGFKSGGINFNLDVSPEPAPNYGILPFDPEEAISYEAGFKWSSPGGRVIANSAAFFMRLDNQQLAGIKQFTSGFIGQQVNAGKLHTSGFELDFQGLVSTQLSIRASAAYFRGAYDEIGAAGVTRLISKSSELALSPKYSFSLGAQYLLPLSNGALLEFDADYAWRDEMQSQANSSNTRTLEAVGLLNAGVTYFFSNSDFSLTVRANNLTNRYYFTGIRLYNNGAPFGQSSADLGRPREWYASVSYQF